MRGGGGGLCSYLAGNGEPQGVEAEKGRRTRTCAETAPLAAPRPRPPSCLRWCLAWAHGLWASAGLAPVSLPRTCPRRDTRGEGSSCRSRKRDFGSVSVRCCVPENAMSLERKALRWGAHTGGVAPGPKTLGV